MFLELASSVIGEDEVSFYIQLYDHWRKTQRMTNTLRFGKRYGNPRPVKACLGISDSKPPHSTDKSITQEKMCFVDL